MVPFQPWCRIFHTNETWGTRTSNSIWSHQHSAPDQFIPTHHLLQAAVTPHLLQRPHLYSQWHFPRASDSEMYEEVQIIPTLICYMHSQQTTSSLQHSKQDFSPALCCPKARSHSAGARSTSLFMLTAQSESTTCTSTRGPEEPARPPLTRETCQGFFTSRFWTATANELRLVDQSGQMKDSLEQEEESSAQEFNIWTQVNIFIEEFEQVGDVGEGQHQERLFQLTKEKAKGQNH